MKAPIPQIIHEKIGFHHFVATMLAKSGLPMFADYHLKEAKRLIQIIQKRN